MNSYLRQSTASQVRTIGPFIDDSDFVTPDDGLTIANTDILVKKNGAASAAKNSGGATADGDNGQYAVTWDATDSNTVGELAYSVKVAGACIVFGVYVVLEEAVYDALFAASAPGYVANAPVNAAQAGGTDWNDGAITRATFAPDTGLQSIRSNTAQGGGPATITIDVGASAVNDFYNGTSILLTGGFGAGQYGIIGDYDGASRVATITAPWVVEPDNTTTFAIFPAAATPEDMATAVMVALATTTFAEPTGVPAATATLVAKVGLLYMALRNGVTVNSNTGKKQFLDDSAAAEWEKDFTDAGGVYTETKGNAP